MYMSKSYSVINGKLVFRAFGFEKRNIVITENELKDLNLQRLIIRRSRPQRTFLGGYRRSRQFI